MNHRAPRAAPLLFSAWALAAAPSFALAQQPPASTAKAQDFKSEFDALVERFDAAQSAYYDEMRALYKDFDEEKASAEQQAAFDTKLSALQTKDPGANYAKEFAELAERAKGTDVGAQSLLQVLQIDRGPKGQTSGAGAKALAALLADYIQSPAITGLPMMLQYAPALGRSVRIDAFNKLISVSKLEPVKAGSMFGLATLLLDGEATSEDKAHARQLLADLVKQYGAIVSPQEKTYGTLAQAYLFELDHLQLGMQVPDFEATDETGAKFKLSDYQGKVVVVDFWGNW